MSVTEKTGESGIVANTEVPPVSLSQPSPTDAPVMTAGPWTVTRGVDSQTGEPVGFWDIKAPNTSPEYGAVIDQAIATCYDTGFGNTEANARAIAALPDLLNAARDAQCSCNPAQRESGHLVECWMPRLDEAIAKATGGVR